ncbi:MULTISPECIES: manganese efflux pump [unclassified Paenibacillus]|uniref:manganese efflux pump n=1 Tax=unclassified Paenibacillus TaxID=185978 RepID=UPI002405298F|nr:MULTISPECIES: manganese efflux pump [unclassified Paenibacillus]MDF9845228.1 putative Mn2+ efflux pump MntP [Paenibacillus sp. PastF-2]MDF9851791.1 putative Mn2+ efflux pump MntP [Paenibacillus sp. PastM-2]MDF9858394.1 putative Mn2+ efflux pump MntP [Paenibacillus sp. PastF-1]MDH6483683.1 putative Mn2+ efflux pump MntP [Paenibacillus sp. PastH-2]MDH6511024.1 putative Mn2+ efflux pump MntP [Paenibacillus sp. PastM-3]
MISPLFSLLLLAFALSLDGFGVGITYGLRKMKIPLLSILIISLCSGIVIGVSMQVGVLLAKVVSPDAASIIGAVILVLMGCWSLIQMLTQKERSPQDEDREAVLERSAGVATSGLETEAGALTELPADAGEAGPQKSAVFSLELRHLGVVIQILRTPSSADMDASGSISSMEAMILGIALSLDAFGAGLGAALLGFSPIWTSLMIALFSGTFLLLGMKTGLKLSGSFWMKHAAALPALLLIAMGIMKLL